MRQRQAVLQKGIDDAKKEALAARQQAKAKRLRAGGRGPPTGVPKAGPQSTFSPSCDQKVTFDLRSTHTMGLSQEVLPPDMRSPSMLQLSTSSHPHISTTPRTSSHPHISTAPRNTTPNTRGSRIPVRSKAVGRNGRGSQISKPTQIVQHDTLRPTRPLGQPPVEERVMHYARPLSPPVPTVAKRLKQQGQLTMSPHKDTTMRGGAYDSTTRGGAYDSTTRGGAYDNTTRGGAYDMRSGSPPVPAQAKKVHNPGDTFTKLPHITSSPPAQAGGGGIRSPPAQAGGGGTHSPPVPALRKKNVPSSGHTHLPPSSGHTHLPPLVSPEGTPLRKQGVILQELSKLRKVRRCGLL